MDANNVIIPADVLIENFESGFPLAADVSIVHPLHPSSSIATVHVGKACAERAKAKVGYYQQTCASRGWFYTPVVCETTGSWGEGARNVVRRLAKRMSFAEGAPYNDCAASIWEKLGTAVGRGIGQQLAWAYKSGAPPPEGHHLEDARTGDATDTRTEEAPRPARIMYLPSGRVESVTVGPPLSGIAPASAP